MAKINRSDRTLPARIWPQTPGDEIVISGISGKFPSSRNLTEFSENLYNKVSFSSPSLTILCHLKTKNTKKQIEFKIF